MFKRKKIDFERDYFERPRGTVLLGGEQIGYGAIGGVAGFASGGAGATFVSAYDLYKQRRGKK